MLKEYVHTHDWVHRHKLSWHAVGIHLDHVIHDPRFWAGLALAILLALMIVTTILSKPTGETTGMPVYPTYPYVP